MEKTLQMHFLSASAHFQQLRLLSKPIPNQIEAPPAKKTRIMIIPKYIHNYSNILQRKLHLQSNFQKSFSSRHYELKSWTSPSHHQRPLSPAPSKSHSANWSWTRKWLPKTIVFAKQVMDENDQLTTKSTFHLEVNNQAIFWWKMGGWNSPLHSLLLFLVHSSHSASLGSNVATWRFRS